MTPLAAALHAARTAAGLLQVPVAASVGMTQARLSRIETGRAIPTEADVTALLKLYEIRGEHRVEIEALAESTRAGIKDQRMFVQRGLTAALQARWLRIQGRSRLIRAYHPAVVHGMLQTSGYARVLFGDDLDGLAARLAQAQELMSRTGKRYVLVQTEGALRSTVGSARVMVEQIEHLIEMSRLQHVRLGVIPARHPMPLVCVAGFYLYEGDGVAAAVVGLEVAAATMTDSEDITYFSDLFSRLTDAALYDDDARDLLAEIAESHRTAEADVRDSMRPAR